MHDKDLEEYILGNGIKINGIYFNKRDYENEENILNQVDNIVKFQNVLMNYHKESKRNLISYIGRENSRLEIWGKNLQIKFYDIDGYSIEKSIINKFNTILLELKDEKFKALVKRATLRNEICIGKVDLGNLRKDDVLEVGKVKKAGYNLIEEDFIKFLKKVKRIKNYRFILKCIDKYIEKSNLNNLSKEYILLKLRIPEESIKYLYKNNIEEIKVEELLKIMGDDEIRQ